MIQKSLQKIIIRTWKNPLPLLHSSIVLGFLLSITFSVAIPFAFAENPTPYNEWDFDFGEIEISQDPRNLDDMIILIPVLYKGDMGLGTVDISARVSNPDGSQFTHPQTVSNMEIGQTKMVKVTHRMSFDGTYIIDMKMTPPEKPYLGHIFDTETLTYVVEPNGLFVLEMQYLWMVELLLTGLFIGLKVIKTMHFMLVLLLLIQSIFQEQLHMYLQYNSTLEVVEILRYILMVVLQN